MEIFLSIVGAYFTIKIVTFLYKKMYNSYSDWKIEKLGDSLGWNYVAIEQMKELRRKK